MRPRNPERGAAAVEFALVVLPLLIILLAIIEFAWIFNQQVSLANAAREAARSYAVHLNATPAGTIADAQAEGMAAAPSVDWTGGGIAITPNCDSDVDGTVTAIATIPTPGLTGMFSLLLPTEMTGEGETICGG